MYAYFVFNTYYNEIILIRISLKKLFVFLENYYTHFKFKTPKLRKLPSTKIKLNINTK